MVELSVYSDSVSVKYFASEVPISNVGCLFLLVVGLGSFEGFLAPYALLLSTSLVSGFGWGTYGRNLALGTPFKVNISSMFFWNIPVFIDCKWCAHARLVMVTAIESFGVVD